MPEPGSNGPGVPRVPYLAVFVMGGIRDTEAIQSAPNSSGPPVEVPPHSNHADLTWSVHIAGQIVYKVARARAGRHSVTKPGAYVKWANRRTALVRESPSMQESFDDIVETFAYLDDWQDRYGYIIDLGRAMPQLDDSLRIAETKVDGCASQVWIVPRIEGNGNSARFFLTVTRMR